MGDSGIVEFPVFFMQSLSFPARLRWYEGGHGRSNCISLFGIATLLRTISFALVLDPSSLALLRPVFAEAVDQIRLIGGGLDVFRGSAGTD